jgi:hypothetical protein
MEKREALRVLEVGSPLTKVLEKILETAILIFLSHSSRPLDRPVVVRRKVEHPHCFAQLKSHQKIMQTNGIVHQVSRLLELH